MFTESRITTHDFYLSKSGKLFIDNEKIQTTTSFMSQANYKTFMESEVTFIQGHQSLAWIDKGGNKLFVMRLCSYSEQLSVDGSCLPCGEGSYTTAQSNECKQCPPTTGNLGSQNALSFMCENKEDFPSLPTTLEFVISDEGSGWIDTFISVLIVVLSNCFVLVCLALIGWKLRKYILEMRATR